jgi:precorrin-3B C17-methyltransferase
VGIGPGSLDHLSRRAFDILQQVDAVVGYTTYIDLIRPLTEGKTVISTAMTKEVDRVEKAIELACQGRCCAVVSSGDAGIYAMAGLVLEMCRSKGIRVSAQATPANGLRVEVIPGIPALCAGAALLGAPLTHDFAAISLSDLLTPWELIARRLDAAAAADFVIVIYNPKSKRRAGNLEKAQQIIMRHRDPETPVGIVTSAMRPQQRVGLLALKDLHNADVDMQTTVFVGNSTSFTYGDHLVTPRGYAGKYDIG